jgi:phosphotransferase family enzyme
MRSPTQRSLSVADIQEILGSPILDLGSPILDAAELSGGGFAAVWRAKLVDGREVVVKVGPPATARLLAYEAGLIRREAEYFRLVADHAPVPAVLAASDDWIVTTLLPGHPLTSGDSPRARAQLGAVVAGIHTLTGPHFGYISDPAALSGPRDASRLGHISLPGHNSGPTGERASGRDWPTAFLAMVAALRADAAAWDVPLPPLDGVVERHTDVLAEVTRPALLHFDLWDGNVLVGPSGELTGLVDGERYLYGDPLLDLVSPALFRRIEDSPDHPFLLGYGLTRFDRSARIRLALYRLHLYVLMLAEGPSRGIGHDRHDRVTRLLCAEIEHLASFGHRD